MDLVLADLQWSTCLVYLDDIIVFGRTFEKHFSRLGEVLSKLRAANLNVKPSKCNLFSMEVQYLGHVISAKGVRADPKKVEAVRTWPVPGNQTEEKSFLRLASYYHQFVQRFAEIARPLHQLTEKGKMFKWDEACQKAFVELKTHLISVPILSYPNPNRIFILDTDASDFGIGAILSQEVDGLERVVAYASWASSKAERRYATTKKELRSMVTFINYFKHYLLGREFVLRTEHNSLKWLHNFQVLEGQLARWMEQLANFQYKIVHRPRRQHGNADVLSRIPVLAVSEGLNDFTRVSGVNGSSVLLDGPVNDVGVKLVCACGSDSRNQEGEEEIKNIPLGWEDELRHAQQSDPELNLLLQLKGCPKGQLENTKYPSLKKYAAVWDQLEVQDGRLVRVCPEGRSGLDGMQVVQSMVPTILGMLHNVSTGGHLGVQKLQGKVRDHFYWPGWYKDIERWCKECVDCASRKSVGQAPCAPLVSSVASYPYEQIALDIVGPLPETSQKNKYILVIGDYFSK